MEQPPPTPPPVPAPAPPPPPPPLPGRASWRSPPPSPRRRLVVVMLVTSALVLLGGGIATLWVLSRSDGISPWRIAEEFVGYLKLGEETAPGDPRIGYMRAYEMLDPALREQIPWESFYQDLLVLNLDHGEILGGEALSKLPRTHRGKRMFVFRLLYGDPHLTREDMSAFDLRLVLDRNGDTWWIEDYEIVPAGDVKSQ